MAANISDPLQCLYQILANPGYNTKSAIFMNLESSETFKILFHQNLILVTTITERISFKSKRLKSTMGMDKLKHLTECKVYYEPQMEIQVTPSVSGRSDQESDITSNSSGEESVGKTIQIQPTY
uniref:Uncharacterized protein n=1 Tax=Glossina pallidipes TaxID=7398 RepID=A0A1B0AK50_GLOPL